MIAYNSKSLKYWEIFLYSLFAYFLFGIAHSYVWENSKFFQALQGACCIFLVYSYLQIPKKLILKGFPLFCYLCYLIVCLITLLRWPFTPMQIPAKFLLLSSSYMWPYLLPFLLFIKWDMSMIAKFYHVLLLYCIFSFIFCIVNYKDFYMNSSLLFYSMIGFDSFVIVRPQIPLDKLFPLSFFAFYFVRWNRNLKVLYVITFLLALVAALMMGRRSCAAIGVGMLMISILLNFNKKSAIKCFGGICVVFFLYSLSNYNFDISLLDNTFQVLFGRIDQDTRSGTEMDFYKDFTAIDWIVGRGVNGTYRSLAVSDIDSLQRIVCETGYLNFILHGGVVLLVPYLFLLLNSIFKGLKKANNSFPRCCSLYLLYSIVLLYPGGFPALSMTGVLQWLCIYVCQSTRIREMSEDNFVKSMNFEKIWK